MQTSYIYKPDYQLSILILFNAKNKLNQQIQFWFNNINSNMTDPMINIQQISSRTFVDPHMQTSIQNFQRNSSFNRSRQINQRIYHVRPSSSVQDIAHLQEKIRLQQVDLQHCKRLLISYANHIKDLEKGSSKGTYDSKIQELTQLIFEKDTHYEQLRRKYDQSIYSLKDTLAKNQILSRQLQRINKKLKESQLNYSRDRDVFNKSQNLISNLSVTKSNYQIQLVTMKDSLVIIEQQKKQIEKSNQEYQQKLALLSQQLQRLRMLVDKNISEMAFVKTAKEKIQTQNKQFKEILGKFQKNEQLLTNKLQEYIQQLKSYHQKLTSKQTMIIEYRERQTLLENTIREKQSQIRSMRINADQMDKSSRLFEQDYNNRLQQQSQENVRLRAIANELNTSKLKLQAQKSQLEKKQEEIIKYYEINKAQYQKLLLQYQNSKQQNEKLFKQKIQISTQFQLKFTQLQKIKLQRDRSLVKLKQQYENYLQKIKQQKHRQIENLIKMHDQKQNNLKNQYKNQYEIILENHNQQSITRMNQNNQLKFQINNRYKQIEHYKIQIKQKNEVINQFKNKLINAQRLVQQIRRQRDLLFQDKQEIVVIHNKSQQMIQLKNSQISNILVKNDELQKQIVKFSEDKNKQLAQIGGYKRVLNDNQIVINELKSRLSQGGYKSEQLTRQINRLVELIRQRDFRIEQLSDLVRKNTSVLDQKKMQNISLVQTNQKLALTINHNSQQKGHFKLFMIEIQRLNEIISGKQIQNVNLKKQIKKIIQKIDLISNQHTKIIRILQNTSFNDQKKKSALQQQYVQLKNTILSTNQISLRAIQHIGDKNDKFYQQITKNHLENKSNINIQTKLKQAYEMLALKNQQIAILSKDADIMRQKLKQTQKNSTKQQQIFEKLIQLSRENAALKQQIILVKTQNQYDLNQKEKTYKQILASSNQLKSDEKKELNRLKSMIEQQKNNYNAQILLLSQQNQQKQRYIRELQSQFQKVTLQIDNKILEMERMALILKENTAQLNNYKAVLKNQNNESYTQKGATTKYRQQIKKLQKIIEIRSQQLNKNEQSYERLHQKKKQLQKQNKKLYQKVIRFNDSNQQLKQLNLQVSQLQQERKNYTQRIRESQQIIINLQQQIHNIQKTSRKQDNQLLKQLKNQISRQKNQINQLHFRIQNGQSHIQQLNMQNRQLQEQLFHILQKNSQLIRQLEYVQNSNKKLQQNMNKFHKFQDQHQQTLSKLNKIQIENDYFKKNDQKQKLFLGTYELKNSQLQKQYLKLQKIVNNMSHQYSQLQAKDHESQIQIKKSVILQAKINELNSQINRLNHQQINLNEEISQCKLAISDGATLERRFEEQLMLIVLLMAEVEALRQKVKSQDQKLTSRR